MNRAAKDILRKSSLPTAGWHKLPADSGLIGQTWLHSDYVLQRRPVQTLQRWLWAREILEPLSEHTLFAGLAARVLRTEKDCFWVLQKRLPGACTIPKRGKWQDSWELARSGLSDIAEAFTLLGNIKPAKDSFPVPRTVEFFSARPEEILWRAQKLFVDAPWLSELPPEPSSRTVLSHGDPITKNIVFAERARLIDWETVAALPRHADPTHFTSYSLKYAPPEKWIEVSSVCQEAFAEVSEIGDRWTEALVWAVLRDFTAYPGSALDVRRWQHGLLRLLAD